MSTQQSRSPKMYFRQPVTLALAVAQCATATLLFGYGGSPRTATTRGQELFYTPNSTAPLILPADYTFAIWGVIFLACIAFGVYQALPSQRNSQLLSHLGWHPALAFGAITAWSIATLVDPIRLTVPFFFLALYGLITSVYKMSVFAKPWARMEKLMVWAPLSIEAGYATVGTIANTAAALVDSGHTNLLLSDQTWAIVMLLAAGFLAGYVISLGRGNTPYALTIVWAFIGIAIGSAERQQSIFITGIAVAMALIMLVVLGVSRIKGPAPDGARASF